MSSYDNSPQQDPRMRNGWAEYQRLVLAELERHGKMIEQLNDKISALNLSLTRLQDNVDRLNISTKELTIRLDNVDTTLTKIEKGNDIEDALSKYRKYILGILAVLVTSVVIPLAKVIFGF